MSRRKRIEPIKSLEIWWCDTCKSAKMNREAIQKHLLDEHKIDASKTKVSRRMLEHWDAKDRYGSLWEVLAGDIKLICSETRMRNKNRIIHERN